MVTEEEEPGKSVPGKRVLAVVPSIVQPGLSARLKV